MSTVRLGVATALLLMANGCTTLRSEMGTPLPPHARQLPERARLGEVLTALGPPTQMSALGHDLVFLYEYVDVRENQIGLSLNFNWLGMPQFNWLKLFKLTLGRARVDRQVAQLIFDEHGVLRSQRFDARADDLGGGWGLQFLVAAVRVVDTGELEVQPYQHKWGAQLLEGRLPVMLNAQYSLRTGRSGVEQLGTGSGAGQHTLEQHLGRHGSE